MNIDAFNRLCWRLLFNGNLFVICLWLLSALSHFNSGKYFFGAISTINLLINLYSRDYQRRHKVKP